MVERRVILQSKEHINISSTCCGKILKNARLMQWGYYDV